MYTFYTKISHLILVSKSLFSCIVIWAIFYISLTINYNNIKISPKKDVICLPDDFEKFNVTRNAKSTSKIFISYVHYLDTEKWRTIENFRFFMHFAHEPCDPEVDFIIIINMDESYSMPIFEQKLFKDAFSDDKHLETFKWCQNERNPHRNTYLILRQNKDGGDLCANVDFLKSDFWLKNKQAYSYYLFINSSARGPFLPNYWTRKW